MVYVSSKEALTELDAHSNFERRVLRRDSSAWRLTVGYAQASRLGEFLQKTPEVRMALTPSVSSRDLVELRRRALESEVAGIGHERRVSPEVAATQLFDQRFPLGFWCLHDAVVVNGIDGCLRTRQRRSRGR